MQDGAEEGEDTFARFGNQTAKIVEETLPGIRFIGGVCLGYGLEAGEKPIKWGLQTAEDLLDSIPDDEMGGCWTLLFRFHDDELLEQWEQEGKFQALMSALSDDGQPRPEWAVGYHTVIITLPVNF